MFFLVFFGGIIQIQMNTQEEIVKQFREQQQKYAYYIIALCVAGIGFALQKTSGLGLSKTQLPLAGAVMFWGASIYCGLRFLNLQAAALYSNAALFDVMEGRHPITGNNPEYIKIAYKTIMEGIEKKSTKTMRLAKWQNRLFYFGILSFVAWRVWEMYCITV